MKLTFIPFNCELNSAINCSEVEAMFLQIHFFSTDCRLPLILLSNYSSPSRNNYSFCPAVDSRQAHLVKN